MQYALREKGDSSLGGRIATCVSVLVFYTLYVQNMQCCLTGAMCRSTGGWSCEIDVEFNPQRAQLSLVRVLIPVSTSAMSSSYTPKTQLQSLRVMGSNDKMDWTTIATGSDAHPYATGWSDIPVSSTENWQYVRIQPRRSSCMMAEVQFVGLLFPTTGPENCDVTVSAKSSDRTVLANSTLDAGYSYLAADTPTVTSVLPTYGSIAGGTVLTVIGAQLDLRNDAMHEVCIHITYPHMHTAAYNSL